MARVKIDLPEEFIFSTEIEVRIGDVLAGRHLGNHSLIAMLNEANPVSYTHLRAHET